MSTSIRFPDFLVIGAMKSGTTTLYHDLRNQPSIFVGEKEPNILLDGHPDDYASFFAKATSSQVFGEVSPDYAKLPDRSPDLAQKVASLFSPKIIFIARNPIDRLISHHAWDVTQQGKNSLGMPEEIDKAVHEYPQLLDYSRYAMQLHPWIEAFGWEKLHFIRFEDYVADRAGSLTELAVFLNVTFDPSLIADSVHNRGTDRPIATPGWRRLLDLPAYRRLLRPLLSESLRNSLRQRLLPKSSQPIAPPSEDTLAFLRSELTPDLKQLSNLLEIENPIWNLE